MSIFLSFWALTKYALTTNNIIDVPEHLLEWPEFQEIVKLYLTLRIDVTL